MLIGYARVSTIDQNLDLQRDALTEAGCERIFTEQISGAVTDRPELMAAISFARSGDTLVAPCVREVAARIGSRPQGAMEDEHGSVWTEV